MTGVRSGAGVLLMTYGSPASLERDDVRSYMTRVRGGREPDEALVAEFERRYRVIGGSPLIEITRRQSAALERDLGWPAAAGMRFSEPTIERSLRELRERGARRVAAIVLSPQYSPLLMGGYGRAIEAARAALGERAPEVAIAGAWHLEPAFVAGLAGRIGGALARFPDEERRTVPVLMTAHSLPLRVAQQEPGYLGQLEETAVAIAEAAGLRRDRWQFCWQSAGHEPGDWMTPDFADLMPRLAAEGHRSVLVAPVQFLADHLEILYDVDVGAREQAQAAGLRFARIDSLNDAPALIEALASVARRALAEQGAPDPGIQDALIH
jgi:protoporphyrin/coproporphyrin ferrochelatase